MKGFYSPIERLLEQSTRGKGTGAEFMTELSKQPGYKQAEVEDRDLQALMALPKMAREEFMAQLKAKPGVIPRERVLSGKAFPEGLSRAEMREREASGADQDAAHHEDYTLPGGSNYREILLQHPKGNFPGVEAHFGDTPNILASIRVKDRIVPGEMGYTLRNKKSGLKGQHYGTEEEAQAAIQGYPENLRPMLGVVPSQGPAKKVLHIEEIQSDWHQQGREKGYATKEHEAQLAAARKQAEEAEFQHKQLKRDLDKSKDWSTSLSKRLESDHPDFAVGTPRRAEAEEGVRFHNEKIMDLMPQVMKAEDASRRAFEEHNRLFKESSSRVPEAPFKKNWHELTLKRMIQHAAENGYDQIAITPGEEQAKRYGLSKHVSDLQYDPETKKLTAWDHSGVPRIEKSNVEPSELPQYLGKEVAQKLMAKDSPIKQMFGEDLNVGGEGMKGFYDKMVPKFLNQFGKKYGAQVQSGAVPIVSTPAQHHGLTESQFQAQPPEEQQRMVRQHAYAHEGAKTTVPVHSFPITPEMREDVKKNGIPMYAEGGEVEVRPTVKDETIQRKVPEMEMAAKALQAGIIDRKEYDRIVNKHKPVKPYTFVPQPATDEDAERALMVNKKPQWRGAEQWPSGRKVGLRLDIPAYESHGVWVNSIHDEEGSGEDKYKTSYGPVSSVKNATFDAGPSKGIKVATGEQNKSPFARIVGELHHVNEDEAVEHMKEHLNHPDWAQVGMDPRRHGFFYDRKTMKPVTHSAHVIQIGPLVLAHKPTYGKRESYAEGGAIDNKAKFLEGSKVKNVLYHATGDDFTEIDPSRASEKSKLGEGFYMTPQAKYANFFANIRQKQGKNAQIMPVHAAIKNPYTIYGTQNIPLNGVDTKKLQKLGHDGIFFHDDAGELKEVVAFHPHQIKSAIGNRGTYDPTKADIAKAKGGAVSRETIKPVAHGIIKERVTVSPNMDAMQYELLSAKHFTKKVK